MKASSLTRFLAVIIVCFPGAWFYSGVSRRNLNQMNTNPAGYLEQLLSRWLPERRGQDQGQAGTSQVKLS